MLVVVVLSQHRVSSSKTVRRATSRGARCMGHAEITWSTVCLVAPHSQFDEGARPHLYIDQWLSTFSCRGLFRGATDLYGAVSCRGRPFRVSWPTLITFVM